MEKIWQEKIRRYMEDHRQEMINDICTLCRIDSKKDAYVQGQPFGPGAAEALAAALRIAEQYGFTINNYDNYVGTADMNDKKKGLDILAHLDVVPAGEGWQITQPFDPIEKNGKLYGRGTADDKGPAMTALYAMRAVRDLGIPLSKNVRLILGTDEESGSADIRHYYSIEQEAPVTLSPDADFPVINIEKGRWAGQFHRAFAPSADLPRVRSFQAGLMVNQVPDRAKAVVEGMDDDDIRAAGEKVTSATGVRFDIQGHPQGLEITAYGKTAHASTPAGGCNALTGMVRLLASLPLAESDARSALQSLDQLFPAGDTSGTALGIAMEDKESGALTLAFSMITMDESGLEGRFDCRVPVSGSAQTVAEPAAGRIESAGFTVDNRTMRAPHMVPSDTPFIRTLLDCYESVTGMKGECLAVGGGTYVHDLKNGVAFGSSMPGTDNRMHGADEFAVIDELMASAEIYALVIAELCK